MLQGKTKAEFLKAEGKDYEANLMAAGVTAAEEDLRDYHDRITNGGRGWVHGCLCRSDMQNETSGVVSTAMSMARVRGASLARAHPGGCCVSILWPTLAQP